MKKGRHREIKLWTGVKSRVTLERSGLKQMKVIEQKIRSLYHSSIFLWLVSAFLHIFSLFRVCVCGHFVCFSPASRPCTQILSVFILAAILNKISTLHGQMSHVISAMCQGLPSCRRHIGKREDPGDEVV